MKEKKDAGSERKARGHPNSLYFFLPNRFVSTSEIVFMLRGSAGRNGVPRLNLTPDPGLTNRRRNDDY
jgi:hypothetical protein